MDTNRLTAKYWRSRGWAAEIVQTQRGKFRYDPFGADVVARRGDVSLWVQACRSGADARRHIPAWEAAAWKYAGSHHVYVLQGWRKVRGGRGYESVLRFSPPASGVEVG